MKVFAHRGAVGPGRVENTLPAVEAAVREGADGVEVDVRLTLDGVAVCSHDRTLLRTAGHDVPIAFARYRELQAVRVSGVAAAPRLEEVVEAVAGRGRLVVEVKRGDEPGGRTAAVAGRVLSAAGAADVVVSSFDPRSLEVLRSLYPHVPTALLTLPSVPAVAGVALARRLGCAEVHPHHSTVRPESVRTAGRRGLGVVPWTVVDADDLRRLAEAGVDAVIVDAPLHAAGRRPDRRVPVTTPGDATV